MTVKQSEGYKALLAALMTEEQFYCQPVSVGCVHRARARHVILLEA